ncbi:AAA family ATPase [Brevibacillus porteri]|uniref:AAA family ATPase n=1 Tax=Brevibacillus porteri TaxID=2126350 RepID=UPI003D201273
MHIRFQKLTMKNYKSHRDLTVDFGELTKITGDNAKGKSSIPEALCWTLYGTDALGSKLQKETEPTPVNYDFDELKVELLFSIDDKEYLLGRSIVKGKTIYYRNEVPIKATEFDEIVRTLIGEKDLFLSLFNPSFFPSMHWESQRKLILQYITAPANKEVFRKMPTAQAEKLAELVKKHSLADLEKIHRDNKNKQDKAYIAAQSRTKTLLEQLNSLPDVGIDVKDATAKIAELDGRIQEIRNKLATTDQTNQRISALKAQIESLHKRIEASKEKWPVLKHEEINGVCHTCKRPLDDKSIKAAEADKSDRMEQYRAAHKVLLDERETFASELEQLKRVETSELHEEKDRLEQSKQPLLDAIKSSSRREQMEQQIEQAKEQELATLASCNDSIFILDAIKAFQAKEAELQASKVQDLFTTLSIRLFKQNKGDGELKPDFEIEMDGKPYRKLSLSESIRAGLELRDVLSQQSGIIAPCFVDNAESITRFTQPNGQLIMCRVVAGQELKIETEATE